MKKLRIPPAGTVFLVPLPPGGFAIGVLVRSDGKGRAYGVFFGPRVSSASEVNVATLKPQGAILRCRFGDHGLHSQRWAVIGTIPGWEPSEWQIPLFSRSHDDAGMCYVTEYNDSLNIISEVIRPAHEAIELPEDAQFGSGVVEVKLGKILG